MYLSRLEAEARSNRRINGRVPARPSKSRTRASTGRTSGKRIGAGGRPERVVRLGVPVFRRSGCVPSGLVWVSEPAFALGMSAATAFYRRSVGLVVL